MDKSEVEKAHNVAGIFAKPNMTTMRYLES